MKNAYVPCLLILIFSGGFYGQSVRNVKALSLWEEAIQAKGGRANLYAISNLVVRKRGKNQNDGKDFQNLQTVDVFLLPHGMWSWIDQRPGFPLTVMQYDFKTEIGYENNEKSTDIERPNMTTSVAERSNTIQFDDSRFNNFAKEKFFQHQLIYLMETKWMHPNITGARAENKGIIIEAAFGRQKFEYYLDPKTKLTKKIKITIRFDDLKTSTEDVFYLSDYVDIAGVKFPQIVSRGKGDDSRTTYLVNVPVNNKLLTVPPSTAAGPDAWRP